MKDFIIYENHIYQIIHFQVCKQERNRLFRHKMLLKFHSSVRAATVFFKFLVFYSAQKNAFIKVCLTISQNYISYIENKNTCAHATKQENVLPFAIFLTFQSTSNSTKHRDLIYFR